MGRLLYLGANNLYGWAMMQQPLPEGDYRMEISHRNLSSGNRYDARAALPHFAAVPY